MSIGLRTNVAATNAITRLDRIGRDLSSVYNHLSSGLRITSASDDAAGLSIASSLKADSRVYAQGIRNINDGASILNVAEGAMRQLSTITIRQRELAEQAANGVYSAKQRQALQAESNALTKEYNRIVKSTVFGGSYIIDGIGDSFRLQQGYGLIESTLLNIGQALGFAAGDGSFASVQQISTGALTVGEITSGDINSDGVADIVAYNSTTGLAHIHLGNGDGTFLFSSATVAGPALSGSNPTLIDINGDGKLDLVAGGSRFTVALGNGDGTFAVARSISSANNFSMNYSLGDFNGDGFLDAAGVVGGTSNIGVILGNGDGTFKAQTLLTNSANINSIVVADFNNDGLADIFASDSAISNSGFIRISNSDGSFKISTINLGTVLGQIQSYDVNNDGFNDILGVNALGGQVEVRLGNGDGTFRARNSYSTFNFTGSDMNAGDLNGDGIMDLAVFGDTSSVIFGNADGSFSAPRTIEDNIWAYKGGLADFNGDGVFDIYSAVGTNDFQIFIGNSDTSGRRNNLTYNLDISNAINAREALVTTSATLTRINKELGNLGALQSRLGTSLNNLAVRRQNYEGAASQILDVDVASESASLTSKRILQQAATAVLSQANQQPGIALKLLGGLR